MKKLQKAGKALLFPHISIMILLLPIAGVLLVFALIELTPESPIALAAYLLSMYTLTIWCVRIPRLVAAIKRFKRENRYLRRWSGDLRLRTTITLCGSFALNAAYAALQLGLGLYHRSFWYCSMAAYYVLLGVMRFYLSRHISRHEPGEQLRAELVRYRACGVVFLAMNLALSLIVLFMVYWGRTFVHHEITTIAMAAYTFASFALSIVGLVKYRKYESPVLSASKAISLATACVSMLTLTTTMLTTFGGEDDALFRRVMLGSLGGAISVFFVAMAVFMIVRANRRLKKVEL